MHRNSPLKPLLAALLIMAGLLLSGCGILGGLSTDSDPSSPYYDRDRPPAQDVDVSQIPNAVPRVEPITRAGNKNPYTALKKTYHLLPTSRGYKERGEASWYGTQFHGEMTANGETYDMFAMTAAHKTLPIPAYVKVTNLDNGQAVIVRVNDRGPFLHDRIIDLSYAAAKKLGYSDKGTARVEVEAIDPHDYQRGNYVERPSIEHHAGQSLSLKQGSYLQVGAFSSSLSALKLQAKVQGQINHPVIIRSTKNSKPKLYKVLVGPLLDTIEQARVRNLLKGSEQLSPFLVHF